jgi:GMP synthase (glutamine-hydrolysing)
MTLLQARDVGDAMLDHEHACFALALGVPKAQITTHNLLEGTPGQRLVEETEMLLVGGSGDYSVCGSEPFIRSYLDFLTDVVVGRQVPTFASCFGFQGLVLAGGGTVETDPRGAEVGTFELTLTEAGRADTVTGPLGPMFAAQLGHKDSATRLPAGTVNLASSARTEYQALRVAGTNIVATQFHPELTRADNTMRYLRYLELYRPEGPPEDDEVLSTMADSHAASGLLGRWYATVLEALR